jgi:hypothetical protein
MYCFLSKIFRYCKYLFLKKKFNNRGYNPGQLDELNKLVLKTSLQEQKDDFV